MEEKTTAASIFQRRHPSFNFQVMGREMVLVLPNSDESGTYLKLDFRVHRFSRKNGFFKACKL